MNVPDDLLQQVLATVVSYLEVTTGRDPTEAEIVTAATAVNIRCGMMIDVIAESAGVDHRHVIRTEMAAAERWRASKEIEHAARGRAS